MDINILFKEATQFHVKGDFVNAEILYKKILSIKHRNFDSLHRLAVLNAQIKSFDISLDFFNKALSINPISTEVLFNRANLFIDCNLPNDALTDIDKALLISRNNPSFFLLKGNAQKCLRDFDGAINSYNQAIFFNSKFHDAYCNRGVIFKELKKYEKAIDDFTTSISLKSDSFDAFTNRAAVYIELHSYDQALLDLKIALIHKPESENALYNLASLYKKLKQFDNATAAYQNVLLVNPNHIESLIHIAVTSQELGTYDTSYKYFLRALEIEPEFRFNRSTFLTLKNKLCIWDDFENEINIVCNEISDPLKVATPFHLLGLIDRPDLHLISTLNYASKECPEDNSLGLIDKSNNLGKVRVAYYSADFHNHATSYLMAQLFELHDRSKFEIFAFSFGSIKNDEMYIRNSHVFDHFIDASDMSDEDITILSRQSSIDIAIDLKGFTQEARPNIFAKRCAPIQVNYLGYPGTLGANYYDYILADKIVIPESSSHFYSEKVIYLPNCYQVNDSKRVISSRVFSKKELGLPEKGFVFCCFNNCYKILPNIFDIWMNILKSVEDSVLWLLDDNPTASSNLLKEANLRGIESHRLIFAKRMQLDEHLARHRFADLFLDTLPYNAHTTASDALWAGLPVLTCSGQSFASRVGASLLHSLNLPELVTHSILEYQSIAIELGKNSDKHEIIKRKLISNLNTKPLFNTKLFAENIENVYLKMLKGEF